MFECDRCGLCCRHLSGVPFFEELDDGTGTCRFLDLKSHRCRIHDSRPLLCNVDRSYEKLFRELMTREEFYQLNHEACKRYKEELSCRYL